MMNGNLHVGSGAGGGGGEESAGDSRSTATVTPPAPPASSAAEHNAPPSTASFVAPATTNNPPPQIFGSFSADGSPIAPTVPAGLFSAEQLSMAGLGPLDEHSEAKRRRIARACDMCRKKKIKCDGKMPKCSHCINYKTECVFTHVEKKRSPPKGAKYIEGLENRLGRMESLLRMSGLLSDEDGGRTDLGTLEKRLADRGASSSAGPATGGTSNRSNSIPSASHRDTPTHEDEAATTTSPRSTIASSEAVKEEEVDSLSDMMCSLVTNNCGEVRYFGSSSGFTIFSPKGIQWVNEKTGDNSFEEMVVAASASERWVQWKPGVFGDMFLRRVYRNLPPKEETLSLLHDFFNHFDCIFPLFHEPTFMHLVDRHYSNDPYEGAGWWASLNVALAISHRLRVMSNMVTQEEDEKAWGYLKNALGVLTELTMRSTDLLSVQALLGMALFLQGTPNPQPSFFLISAAIRVAHTIGLHKRGSSFGLRPVEIEQRKRVFWIAYMLDKDICLRSGRPPCQDDDDMNVDLPSENPDDDVGNIPLPDGKSKVNLFLLMCKFSTIESKVYKQLYSVKASKQSDGELLNTIGELDHELEEWKDSIPIEFRPEHDIKVSHAPLILHIAFLHFAYYNCLTTIHRMSVHHGYWTSRLSEYALAGLNARPLNPRVFSSAALCVAAARASIHLIKYVPQGDFACVWLIMYFPVSALVTLFANILQNPHDTRARADIRLMNIVVNFLSNMMPEETDIGLSRMLRICKEFERVARVVLDKADKEASMRRKRKSYQGTTPSKPQLTHLKPSAANQQQQHGSPSQLHQQYQQPQTSPSHPNPPSQPLDLNSNGASGPQMDLLAPNMNWMSDLSGTDLSGLLSPTQMPGGNTNGNDDTDFGGNGIQQQQQQNLPFPNGSPLNFDGFQHPFVPQDLWQMPMTLEWDWNDMIGLGNGGQDMPDLQQQQQQNGF